MHPYKVGDQIRLKKKWDYTCPLPVGATATVTKAHDYDTFRCVWDAPHDKHYAASALFGGATKWFELVDGPW